MKALLLLVGLALIQIPIGLAFAESFQTAYVEENNQVHAIGDLPEGTQAIWLLAPIQGGVHESYYFQDRAWLSGVNMSSHESIPDGWGGYSSSAQLPSGIYEWVATSNSLAIGKPTTNDILEFSTFVEVISSSQTTPESAPEYFIICHTMSEEILVNEQEFTAHEAHGDTFGACVEPLEIGTNEVDKKDQPDEKNNPVDYNNLPNYDTFKVCHNNKLIDVAANGVRYHLQHGDQQFECPVVATPTTVDRMNIQELDTSELFELLMRIFEELRNR